MTFDEEVDMLDKLVDATDILVKALVAENEALRNQVTALKIQLEQLEDACELHKGDTPNPTKQYDQRPIQRTTERDSG